MARAAVSEEPATAPVAEAKPAATAGAAVRAAPADDVDVETGDLAGAITFTLTDTESDSEDDDSEVGEEPSELTGGRCGPSGRSTRSRHMTVPDEHPGHRLSFMFEHNTLMSQLLGEDMSGKQSGDESEDKPARGSDASPSMSPGTRMTKRLLEYRRMHEMEQEIAELKRKLKVQEHGNALQPPSETTTEITPAASGTEDNIDNGELEERARLGADQQGSAFTLMTAELQEHQQKNIRLESQNEALQTQLKNCKIVIKRLVKELEMCTGVKMVGRHGSPETTPPTRSASEETGSSKHAPRTPKNDGRQSQQVGDADVDSRKSLLDVGTDAVSHLRGSVVGAMTTLFTDMWSNQPNPALQWSDAELSINLELSPDRQTVSFAPTADEEDLYAFACTRAPVEMQTGFGFEVSLRRLTNSRNELGIGLTPVPPENWPHELPETADCLDRIWLMGYDGEMWSGSANKWVTVPWRIPCLKEGDRVGVHAEYGSASMELFVNGQFVGSAPWLKLQQGEKVWGVVDLLGTEGCVKEVALLTPTFNL